LAVPKPGKEVKLNVGGLLPPPFTPTKVKLELGGGDPNVPVVVSKYRLAEKVEIAPFVQGEPPEHTSV
jgi:hypothetical protein